MCWTKCVAVCILQHLHRRMMGIKQRPSQRMQGWAVTVMNLKTCVLLVLHLSVCLFASHTPFSQMCCVVSHAGKVPFPSISGRLQRSVIREIDGTGPISCLVPFESAKLLRTSKKISQFIWDLLSFLCKCQTHTTKPMCSLTELTAQTHAHTHTRTHTHTHTYI